MGLGEPSFSSFWSDEEEEDALPFSPAAATAAAALLARLKRCCAALGNMPGKTLKGNCGKGGAPIGGVGRKGRGRGGSDDEAASFSVGPLTWERSMKRSSQIESKFRQSMYFDLRLYQGQVIFVTLIP